MLDRLAVAAIGPAVLQLARVAKRLGASPNGMSFTALGIGLCAAGLIALQWYAWGAALILLSRLFDAIDGALARLTDRVTDQGGFLDIALDFLFYASIPLAFAFADPGKNALAAATLLAAFIGTGSSFLAFAVLAAKRGMGSAAYPDKSFYFLGGLTEATETLAFFVAMCLWPQIFSTLAYIFAFFCAVTIVTRIRWGMQVFR